MLCQWGGGGGGGLKATACITHRCMQLQTACNALHVDNTYRPLILSKHEAPAVYSCTSS